MSVRVIRLLGDPVLRTHAEAVTSFDAQLRALVRDLMETIDAGPGRAGLAAPQIGFPVRVFAYAASGSRGYLVNPVIVERSGRQEGEEGCLSVPDLAFATERAEWVTVTGSDEYGAAVTVSAEGFLARAMQHEVDHLDGVLYLDRLTGTARRQALRAVRAAPWAHQSRRGGWSPFGLE